VSIKFVSDPFKSVCLTGPSFERDEVLTWMENNREQNSQILDSTNFEHLTQAATGATTGDWFILL